MKEPLHRLDAQYATLDEPTLMTLFERASHRGDTDELEPLVRQLVLRAVPVIARTVREFGPARGLGPEDLVLVEEEAIAKLMLRLARGVSLRSVRALAYDIARACAEDPERRPAPARKATPGRPGLRVVDGGLTASARTNGRPRERGDG